MAEGNETVAITGTVVSSASDDGTVLGPVTVTIVDDDMATLALSVDQSSIAEAGGVATVTVSAAGGTFATDRTVDLSFGGTATEGTDYAVSSSQLLLLAGASSVTATVTAVPDDVAEGNETVAITGTVVSSASDDGTVLGPVTVTIVDDDMATLALSVDQSSIAEAGGVATVTVSAAGGTFATDRTVDLSFGGTATEGTDYAVSSSQLLLLAGASSVTATVTAVPDDVAEGNETVAITGTVVSSASDDGAVLGPVTVTIVDDDMALTPTPRPTEVEAVEETVQAVAATSLSNVTANIGTRFSAARGGGSVLSLAGRSVPTGSPVTALAEPGQQLGGPHGHAAASDGWSRGAGFDELLRTSAFELSLNAAEGEAGVLGLSHWTLWGRGDILAFDSDAADARYDGDLRAGYVGLDAWLDDRWQIGVAASRIQVTADYSLAGGGGELDVALNGIHPYARLVADERREFWIMLGAGAGEIKNVRNQATGRESNDVDMYMAAAGARQAMGSLADGLDVALLGDAGFGRLSSNAGTGLETIDNLAVDTWRARVGAEASYAMAQQDGTSITPFAEVAARIDGGGEEGTETGIEVAAGVFYADPASGFGLEARGRMLALYSGDDYQEYGASLTASLSPGAGGEGLSLSLSPRLGSESSGVRALWA